MAILPSFMVKLCPGLYEVIKMLGSQDRPISCQIVKIVHDNSQKQIEHLGCTKQGLSVDPILPHSALTRYEITATNDMKYKKENHDPHSPTESDSAAHFTDGELEQLIMIFCQFSPVAILENQRQAILGLALKPDWD